MLRLLKTLWEKEKILLTKIFSCFNALPNKKNLSLSKLKAFDWLIDWMVLYATFNSISVISRWQITLFMLYWVSPVLGWALKCLAQGHPHEKTQRIQCGSNPGPLDYESNTLPLSHMGPKQEQKIMWEKEVGWLNGVLLRFQWYFRHIMVQTETNWRQYFKVHLKWKISAI